MESITLHLNAETLKTIPFEICLPNLRQPEIKKPENQNKFTWIKEIQQSQKGHILDILA